MNLLKKISMGIGGSFLLSTGSLAQIPIEHLAQNPAFTSMSMSDDGTYIAGLVKIEGDEDLSLAVWDTDNLSKPPVVTPANDRMKFVATAALKADKIFVIGQQAWTGNAGGIAGCTEGLARSGSVKTFLQKVYITDTKAKKFKEPFKKTSNIRDEALKRCFELSSEASIASFLPLSDTDVLIFRQDKSTFDGEYYRVNLKTNTEKMVYRETPNEGASLWDPRDGELLATEKLKAIEGNDYRFETYLKDDSGNFVLHDELTVKARSRVTMNLVGRDEKSGNFYVITDKFSNNTALYFYDPVAQKFSSEALFAHPEYDVSGVWLDTRPDTFNQLLGVRYQGAQSELYTVDGEWAAIIGALEAANPGMDLDILDFTDDLSKVLYVVSSSTTPPSYYLLKDKQVMLPIGQERPWFESDKLRETELVFYTARDGMKIPGFLTLPKDWKREDGPLPSIVLPHGGPWARDDDGWDASGWPQFLASRGYAVLQPQYRGSEGWGLDLWRAGDAKWGMTMQDDKDDGAAWLVSQGIAHEDRIAIFGYSYGGFAAMAATVRENGPFKCAIAGAGVSNLTRLGNTWSDSRVQRAYQGWTVTGMDPMRNTDKANIPILIYHGDRDVRVPLFHATDFYNKIKNKVDAKLVVIKDMKHSLPWWPEHHRESLTEIENFLKNDCKL